VIYCQTGRIDKNKELLKSGLFTGLAILPGIMLGYLAGKLDIEVIVNYTNIITFTIGFTIIAFVMPFLIPDKRELHKENYFFAVTVGLMFMYVGLVFHEI